MNKTEILNAVRKLSASQGFYGRLYEILTNGTEESEKFLNEMVEQKFTDVIDMVLWLEA